MVNVGSKLNVELTKGTPSIELWNVHYKCAGDMLEYHDVSRLTASRLISQGFSSKRCILLWWWQYWNIGAAHTHDHPTVCTKIQLLWPQWHVWKFYSLVPPLLLNRVHDDVIKWKHFRRNWPFGRGIHRSAVNSFHRGQWRGALVFSLICDWINDWVNNGEAGDLRRHRAHYDVIVMVELFYKKLKI